MSASLWPCLHTPSDKIKNSPQQSIEEVDFSGSDHIKSLRSIKGCIILANKVDLDRKEDVCEGIDDDTLITESDRVSLVASDFEGIIEVWMSSKKKGRRCKIIEPPLATRKSSKIQDQGIPM